MPSYAKNFFWGIFPILLAGCVAYHPKPLSPSQTASAFEARTLDSPDLKKFIETHLGKEISPWPPPVWDFQLLTLAAYNYHPDLDVARLAPILMTALVTGLGLLPLAIGREAAGQEIEGPMAIVILGGLITSTALNLLMLPTLALKYGGFGKKSEEG